MTAGITIDYTNHRGERGLRRIVPTSIAFGSNEWHPEPQWLLWAVDTDKRQARAFAVKDIHAWDPKAGQKIETLRSTSQAGGVPAGLVAEVTFLLERLDQDVDFGGPAEDIWRDYNGHVAPAVSRVRSMLSASPPPPATDGDALRDALEPILALPAECVNALTCQRQIDMDGVEVGVSRQAVDEIHDALTKTRNALASVPTPVSGTDAGSKILAGLQDAAAGNLARVTIEGQTWVRADAVEVERAKWAAEFTEVSNRLRAVEKIQGMVRADEREACALVAEQEASTARSRGALDISQEYTAPLRVAAAIRSRGTDGGTNG